MPKQCNINSRGKATRLFVGLLMILMACVIGVLIALGSIDGIWPWVVALSVLPAGMFTVYEGWSGWCAMRALGIKTWI